MLTPQLKAMGIGLFLEKQDRIVTSFSHGGANGGLEQVYLSTQKQPMA
jgi:hypothetical protein